MRIKDVTIKSFRSFDEVGVNISFPEINLPISIVGHNNSGKTNLINGILNACGYKEYGQKYSLDDFYCHKSENNAEVIVHFSDAVKIPTIYGADKDKECLGAQMTIKENFGDITCFSYALDKNDEALRSQEQLRSRSLPVLINKYKDGLNLFYIDFQNLEKYLRINSYSLLGKVLEDVKADFKAEDNQVKDRSGQDISREEYFKKILDFVEVQLLKTDKFKELLKNIENVIKKQLELEDDSISISFNLPGSDDIYDSMKFKLSDNTTNKPPIPLDRLGDGFRAMLIIAILRVLINTSEGGKIIILEEPETFLHEHFQEYFYSVLCDLAKNNQVIYTTHSKKFVNIFEPDSIIKLKNDDYLKSEVVNNKDKQVKFPEELDGFLLKQPDDYPKFIRSLEPNLGNIIFADKVVIVEGPLDLMVYKNIFSEKVNFGLKNIALISAWGKDSIRTLIQLCKRFEVLYFVIHDWDLDDNNIDITIKPSETNSIYQNLDPKDKAQYTKNHKIFNEAGVDNLHHNKRNLESVLKLDKKDKSSVKVFEKISGKTFNNIKQEFPNLINDNLLTFLKIN